MSKKLTSFAREITVEPAYFLIICVHVIIHTTNTNLLLQKKCRINQISEPDLNIRCNEYDEKQGIIFTSEVTSVFRFLTLICTSCAGIFAASWSDAAGRRRRPLIFLPIIGQMFQAIIGCLNSYFWSWSPILVAVLCTVSEIITGGMAFVVIGTQIYICDISSMENRTMRMGILMATEVLADLIGYGGSGFILRGVGFFFTYLLCFVLSIVSIILAVLLFKDISVPVEEKSSACLIKTHMLNVVDGFRTVFKRSLGKKRIVVLMLLLNYLAMSFITRGEAGILYLYMRYVFHWEERRFSLYLLYRQITVISGNIFCSVVLSKRLQVHDGLIGAFAATCDTIAALGYLFASKEWHLYIVPLFDVFHGAAMSISFSFMSKFYNGGEFGRLSSVQSVCMLIVPICFPLYNGIFNATLNMFPSAFFLLSISLNTIVALTYCVSYLLARRLELNKEVEEVDITDGRSQRLKLRPKVKKPAVEDEDGRMIN